MADIDDRTGLVIDNYSSALQSVGLIFSTPIGSRVMGRELGAGLMETLGRKVTPSLLSVSALLMQAAIDVYEKRFRVRRVVPTLTVDGVRLGDVGFSIEVDWRPRGHLGDFTVEGVRTFGLSFIDGLARAA